MKRPLFQFAARSKDKAELRRSTSGAAFAEIARAVLSNGGVVFGAAWSPDFRVVHQCAENLEALENLRGSKYAASDLSGVFEELSHFLAQGRQVLFSGTPCQTAAVRKRFGDDPNLFLCAVMCYSVAEASVWEKYLAEIRQLGGSVRKICFRDKCFGWANSKFSVEFGEATKNFSESATENVYLRAFYSGLSTKDACLKCPFRSGNSGADVMIGDFWGVEKTVPRFADDRGVNAVLVYTSKGQKLMGQSALDMEPVDYAQILAGNPCLEVSPKGNLRARKRFRLACRKMSLAQAIDFSFRLPLWKRILSKARRILG